MSCSHVELCQQDDAVGQVYLTHTLTVLLLFIKVLCPTQHKMGHFGDVPQANLLAWRGKTKHNTTKAHIHQSKEMSYNTKKSQF